MKKVVVMPPVQQRHKELLGQQVSAYPGAYEFVYLTAGDPRDYAAGQIKDAAVIIGRPSPDLLKEARKLEWLHLSTAGAALDVTQRSLSPPRMSCGIIRT